MSEKPWLKFYPRDWRGDQAVRVVSLPARGLWIDMLCIMYEGTPYGHLTVGAQPMSDAELARLAGSTVEVVQALLVELLAARVARRTRGGVIYSKRMIEDDKRAKAGRKAKLEALEKERERRGPSRGASSPPSTQRPEARAKDKGPNSPLSLSEAKNSFSGPKEVRDLFLSEFGEAWCRSYLDGCDWQDVPFKALTPETAFAAKKIIADARKLLWSEEISVLGRAA